MPDMIYSFHVWLYSMDATPTNSATHWRGAIQPCPAKGDNLLKDHSIFFTILAKEDFGSMFRKKET